MIEVRNLRKLFGAKTAVDGVSFKVEMGEVLGFLGPNGAGKSTTMRMITGFIPPSGRAVFVGGFDMLDNPLPVKTPDRCVGIALAKRAVDAYSPPVNSASSG
jgi:ABC-2 type transport system ATP-binding protein